MHSLTIAFGTISVRFLFKTKEKAEEINKLISDLPTQDIHFTDDFGQTADIKGMSVHGRIMENLDESQLAQIEMMLHNTRIQAKAQERANSDPVLTGARRGPGVLTPAIGNGMMR